MKRLGTSKSPYKNGDETYGNQFVNPVVNSHLGNCTQFMDTEYSVAKTVSACFNVNGDKIGILTAVWGIVENNLHVFAYDFKPDDQEEFCMNDTSKCTLISFVDAQSDRQADDIEIDEFIPEMKEYWNRREASRSNAAQLAEKLSSWFNHNIVVNAGIGNISPNTMNNAYFSGKQIVDEVYNRLMQE